MCAEEPKPPASVCRSGGRSGHMKCLGGQHGPWARVRGARGHQTRAPGSRGHVCLIPGPPTRAWGAQGACEPPFGVRPGPEECGMLWVFIDWVQREEQPAGVMIKLDSRSGERGKKWEEIPTFVICLMPNITPPRICIAGRPR